ncbi:hypothetical protein PPTG_10359 [Phytophthora nicotianae INRA-310]|uniref:ubiquitinyl hydrolase 1 n=1 Tax=Phytophthora nicotianae (strain INRA-310) TaxID=761204 RepID=W2QE64_PHYN3|nr:hypothetical protein PPTG_10359 [Phytophthora nicotianae INRA-310]ETN11483.1 hypothetical protein PPTG_10359 [Phytophthora nicotianae INRA-310]
MGAINFFLNMCVFPRDTTQYSQCLSRTAWNLAAGDNNIGLSGTNNNHRLLPLSVQQCEPNEPLLVGTNGKMIDKILQVTQGYEVIRPISIRSPIPWQDVLLFAIDKKTQALIDTGALLAGVSNLEAAQFLLDQNGFVFGGVTYYDSRMDFNCWMIAEKTRRVVMPLKKSSMLESETFVVFDEARSRGSDMKLPSNASAVLTLGPKLTKDKLMQGAGRMRQLGCNQTLWIACFDEKKIARVIESTARIHFEGVDDALISRICRRGRAYGLDDEVCIAAHTDECEQELRVEEEEEREQDREVAVCKPMKEKRWAYSRILDARSIEDLRDIVNVVSMENYIREWITLTNLADLVWTSAQIFGTENFFVTIKAQRGLDCVNEFLRVIDVILIFENGQVLLVSECEADQASC